MVDSIGSNSWQTNRYAAAQERVLEDSVIKPYEQRRLDNLRTRLGLGNTLNNREIFGQSNVQLGRPLEQATGPTLLEQSQVQLNSPTVENSAETNAVAGQEPAVEKTVIRPWENNDDLSKDQYAAKVFLTFNNLIISTNPDASVEQQQLELRQELANNTGDNNFLNTSDPLGLVRQYYPDLGI